MRHICVMMELVVSQLKTDTQSARTPESPWWPAHLRLYMAAQIPCLPVAAPRARQHHDGVTGTMLLVLHHVVLVAPARW